MPMIIPFIPLIASVAGGLLSRGMGGKEEKGGGGEAAAKAKASPLFAPAQIEQAKNQYTQAGNAKWGQIAAGMGGQPGAIGQAPMTEQISNQANQFAQGLGGLTTESGYNPADTQGIYKNVESQFAPKFNVYG